MEEEIQLLVDFLQPKKREEALLHLSRACTLSKNPLANFFSHLETLSDVIYRDKRKKETIPGLAILLWETPSIVAALIQEILRVYPYLSPPTLSSRDSTRVCHALSLFQCIASESSLRPQFLKAKILEYIYPLLISTDKSLEFEHLRMTSLGVIGAVLKGGSDWEVLHLLGSEFVPLCLRSIDRGTQPSKVVATFILEKILVTDIGLTYACATVDRFFRIHQVLSSMVESSTERPSIRLLRHIIRCYLRLSRNARGKEVLRIHLPGALRDGTFSQLLQVEDVTRVALTQLLDNTAPKVDQGVGNAQAA